MHEQTVELSKKGRLRRIKRQQLMWELPKTRVPYFGAFIVRILLFGVLYEGSLFSETPMMIPFS